MKKTNTTVPKMHNLRYIIVKNSTGSQQTQTSFPVDSGQYRLLVQILLISYNSYWFLVLILGNNDAKISNFQSLILYRVFFSPCCTKLLRNLHRDICKSNYNWHFLNNNLSDDRVETTPKAPPRLHWASQWPSAHCLAVRLQPLWFCSVSLLS